MEVLELPLLTDEKIRYSDDMSDSKPSGRKTTTSIPADAATKDRAGRLAQRWEIAVTLMNARLLEWIEKQDDRVQQAAFLRLPSSLLPRQRDLLVYLRDGLNQAIEEMDRLEREPVITETPPRPSSRQSPEPQGPTDDRLSPRPSTLPGNPPRPGAGKRK
jgi:hypothetical protein